MNDFVRTTAILALTFAVAACGGGGSDPSTDSGTNPPPPVPQNLEITLEEPTGPVDNSTLGNWDNTLLGVGEFGPDNQFMNNWRGIMTFDISGIPAGATIQSAELVAFQFQVNGDPYFNLGRMIVDHIEMGPAMDGTAYDGFTVANDVATLSTDETIGIKSVNVTALVQRDLDAATTGLTQLRLRFQNAHNGNATIDNAFIAGPESANSAFLKITYTE